MRNLLLLISSLDYSGPARRLCCLARGLSREQFLVRVVVLETATPWVEALRQAGITVDVLDWKRPFDLQPFLALRRLLTANGPTVVHAFGPTALRAVKMCSAANVRVLGSDLLPGGRPGRGWAFDRWLLRGANRVLAFGAAQAQRYRHYGVSDEQISQVTPGVELGGGGEASGWPGGRVLLAVGPMEVHKGFRDAVWAFDILHYLFDDLRLALLGDGPDRPHVAEFARAIAAMPLVTFLGKQPAIEPYLERAAVVWIPSRTAGGVSVALEAMAAGRPVVAAHLPELAEIVVDGETGYLVPPGDKAALARKTRFLLSDSALAVHFGEAGKQRVAERFSAARMVVDCAAIYEHFRQIMV